MSQKKNKRFITAVLVIWLGMIFFYSSQSSHISNDQSNRFLMIYEKANQIFDFSNSQLFKNAEKLLFDGVLEGKYESANAKIRKSAHFGIYFVLGVFSAVCGWLYFKSKLLAWLIGLSLPTVIAALDEFNQGLRDRTSSVADVVLDGLGAACGATIVLVCLVLLTLAKLMVKQMQKSKQSVKNKL